MQLDKCNFTKRDIFKILIFYGILEDKIFKYEFLNVHILYIYTYESKRSNSILKIPK